MSGDARLRLTVDGPEELQLELDPAEAEAIAGPHRRPEVRELVAGAEDRAAGRRRYEVTVDGWVLSVGVESAARAALRERASAGAGAAGPTGRSVVKAQIPGRVVRLWVASGEVVEKGQRLLAIEAMKMENEIRAPRAGTIGAIAAVVGRPVELGDELVVIE